MNDKLKYIYVINKNAKKLSEKSKRNYNNGFKRQAKIYSLRKDALYDLKSECLSDVVDFADSIVVHKINDKNYYYFNFENFGFHSPVKKHDIDYNKSDIEVLEDFEKSVHNEIDISLKSALQGINSKMGYNANNFLSKKYLDFYFVGWNFL